jgi:hypothetical protein
MKQIILLVPPKMLLQHSVESWLDTLTPQAVIFTCASAKKEIEAHLVENFEVHFNDNFNDNPMVELEVYQRATALSFPLVVALAEIDLERAARVNDRLGVTKGAASRISYFRDKFSMKTLAHEKGIKIPPMARVHSATDLCEFIELNDFPVVIKPCNGRGSNGVQVLRNKEQVNKYLLQQNSTTFFNLMVEKFIQGDHYQVNGLVISGQPVVISTSKALVSCLDFLSGDALGLQMLDPRSDLVQKIDTFANYLLFKVLPAEETFLFHLEVFVTDCGDIVLGEIASRLGGCFVNEEIQAAWGIDLRMTYLSYLRNPAMTIPNIKEIQTLVGQLLVPPQHGFLLAAPTSCDLDFVLNYKFSGDFPNLYLPMSFTNSEIMSAIVQGGTELEVKDNLRMLLHWFRENSDWQLVEEESLPE